MKKKIFTALLFFLLLYSSLSLAQQHPHPHLRETTKILIDQLERGDFISNILDDFPAHKPIFADKVTTLNAIIPDFQVNEKGGLCFSSQLFPSIATDSSGNCMITWIDERNGDLDIYAQRYSADGSGVGTNFKVNDNQGRASQVSPAISVDGSGNFVITWADLRNRYYDIYAQCYSSDGREVGANFKVNDDQGSAIQGHPSISTYGNGNFVITWRDERNGDLDIYAQRYSDDGSAVGTNFKVNDHPGSADQGYPSISTDNSGNFVITWRDERNGDEDIYAQRYSSAGSVLGTNFKVNDDQGSAIQGHPSISSDNSGNFMITWKDERNEDRDIYAQRYSADGSVVGTNFKVNDDPGSADQGYPSISTDSGGNFVVTWSDERNGDQDIYAQRYSDDGSVVGTNFKVNDDEGSTSQGFPAISTDGSGNFVITWHDDRYGYETDIYVQRYSSNGSLVGTNFKANDDQGWAYQFSPSISIDGSGNFVITWGDTRNRDSEIYAQRYSSDGSAKGINFKVSNEQENISQSSPSVSTENSGNFIITWEGGYRGIYAQRYSCDGNAVGTIFKVNDNLGKSTFCPSISTDGRGNFVITWIDHRNGYPDIYAQCYSGDGSAVGMNFKVNDDQEWARQYSPSISSGGSGNFVFTWIDERNGDWDIYAQRYSGDGSALGANFKVNDDREWADQYSPSISSDGSGNFVITWGGKGSGDTGIYAQRYLCDGSTVGTNFKVVEKQGRPSLTSPSISTDSNGNFVITWEDYRNGHWDIYAQRYFRDGSAKGINFRVTQTGEKNQHDPDVKLWNGRIYTTWKQNRAGVIDFDIWANVLDWENPAVQKLSVFTLSQNYPNPFNSATIIQYELPQVVKVKISIFNLPGQRVKVLENSFQQAGSHSVQWDGKDEKGISLASGIYICRIETGEFRKSIKLMLVK